MKKALLFFIAFLSIMQASAQDITSGQDQSGTVSIDKLVSKVSKLQNDFNYLSCDHELTNLNLKLNDLSHSIDISAGSVVMDIYFNNCEQSIYNSYENNYNSEVELFNALKNEFETVKSFVSFMKDTSDFSKERLDLLTQSVKTIEKSIKKAEASLNYYSVAIKTYRNKL